MPQYCNAHNLKSPNSSVNLKFSFCVFCLHRRLQMSIYIGSPMCWYAKSDNLLDYTNAFKYGTLYLHLDYAI